MYNNLSSIYLFKREFSNAKELLNFVLQEGTYFDRDEAILEKAWTELMLSNVDEALRIFEEQFPEVTNDSILDADWTNPLHKKYPIMYAS